MKFHRINRCVIGVPGLLLALLFWGGPVMAIDPINDDLMIQVRTARDLTERFDEPAIGPLLSDVHKWKTGDVSNARIPDYATLFANPGKYRGEVFLIEGLFAGVPKREQLAAPKVGLAGPWDGKAELWTVVVDDAKDMVVVVLLTDPPKELPKGGAKVKLPARLYKVWSYKDLNKTDQAALVFVGKTLDVTAAAPTVKKSDTTVVALSIAVFAGFCVLIYFFRAMKKKYSGDAEGDYRERLRQRMEDKEIGAQEQGTRVNEEPLPKDPVEALKELERRAGRG
jgi:hypothetical protein